MTSTLRSPRAPILQRPEARAGLVATTATTLVGGATGSLGGATAAVIFAAVGLLWGAVLSLAASLPSRTEPRRRAWAAGLVFATVLAAGLLTGSSLFELLVMQAALSEAPPFFAELVRPPIGDAIVVPFYLLNTPLEWLLVPGTLLLTWRVPRQRRLVLAAAVVFVFARVWTYLWFVPQISDWSEGPAGVPLSPDQLDQAGLWVDLSWIRLAIDLATVALVLLAAFVPAGEKKLDGT